MAPQEIESAILAYAAKRGVSKTAAVKELSRLLDVHEQAVWKWINGTRKPTAQASMILQFLALPRGVKINVLTYPNPADDDLDGTPQGGEFMRRQMLAAAAMAGVGVREVPFDRAAYDRWRDGMPDTRQLRAEWAGLPR